jgi:predicted enzyme related to lactoylglutathione lyase
VHPAAENNAHQVYLLCDDIEAFITEMTSRGVTCGPLQTPRWGTLTEISLPGGGKLGVYQPKHARP